MNVTIHYKILDDYRDREYNERRRSSYAFVLMCADNLRMGKHTI